MFERLGNEVAGYRSKTSTNDPAIQQGVVVKLNQAQQI